MNWIELISLLLGGTSLLSVIGAVMYFKPRSKIENLNANEKDIQVTDSSLLTLNSVSKQLGEAHKEMGDMRKSIATQDMAIMKLRQKVTILIEIAERQIDLKKYAESHLCTIVGCESRTPPFGTYKSSSDSSILKKLIDELREHEDDSTEEK